MPIDILSTWVYLGWMNERMPNGYDHEIFDIDFSTWDRLELEQVILRDVEELSTYIRGGVDIGSGDDYSKNSASAITYVPDDDNWSGHIIKLNPASSEHSSVSVQLLKINRNTYDIVEAKDIKFPAGPIRRKQRREFFEYIDHEELVALATVFSNVINGTQSHEDKKLLFSLYEQPATEPVVSPINETAPATAYIIEPFLVADAEARLDIHGSHDDDLNANYLFIGIDIDGLVYRAALWRKGNSGQLDELALECSYENQVMDTITICFDSETGVQIPDNPPERKLLWNEEVLSELFLLGQKLSHPDAAINPR